MEKIHVSIVYIFFYFCFRPKLDVKRGKKRGKKVYFYPASIRILPIFSANFPNCYALGEKSK